MWQVQGPPFAPQKWEPPRVLGLAGPTLSQAGAAALLPNAGRVGELREVGPLVGIQGVHAVVCGKRTAGPVASQ